MLQLGTRLPSSSWVALLADTVGLDGVSSRRFRIGGRLPGSGEVRLVVQVFGEGARPLGAAERVVTVDELAAGVDLSVVYEGCARAERVVAWAEPNARELEFGALTATAAAALAWAEGPVGAAGTALQLRPDLAAAA